MTYNTARIVIDTGFGDAGKGMVTDALCTRYSVPDHTIVIRFNGGHQAGHTVMLPDGRKHIHSSFPSGTLSGFRGYITEHCVIYPPGMMYEFDVLRGKRNKFAPQLIVHPLAIVTTPYDIRLGQAREMSLQHGSCGVGIGATMTRHNEGRHRIHAVDLFNPFVLAQKLRTLARDYGQMGIIVTDSELEIYMEYCEAFRDHIGIAGYEYLTRYCNFVFEGAQGVLLDKDHGMFPNVTYGNTTSKNALDTIRKIPLKFDDIDVYYVTRCYQTRHGNGPMSDERNLSLKNNEHEINTTHHWQGVFRVGLFDPSLVEQGIRVDKSYHSSYDIKTHLIITCIDQLDVYPYVGNESNETLAGLKNSVYGLTSGIYTSSDPYSSFQI